MPGNRFGWHKDFSCILFLIFKGDYSECQPSTLDISRARTMTCLMFLGNIIGIILPNIQGFDRCQHTCILKSSLYFIHLYELRGLLKLPTNKQTNKRKAKTFLHVMCIVSQSDNALHDFVYHDTLK